MMYKVETLLIVYIPAGPQAIVNTAVLVMMIYRRLNHPTGSIVVRESTPGRSPKVCCGRDQWDRDGISDITKT